MDGDGRTIAEDRRLLHGRFDIGKAVTIKLEVLDQRTMAHPHVEIGMQIEPEAGKNVGIGAAAAADAAVALEHGDTQTGTRQVSGERQAIMTRADDNSVELSHRPEPT